MRITALLGMLYLGSFLIAASLALAESKVESKEQPSSCEDRVLQCMQARITSSHQEAAQNWQRKFNASVGTQCMRELEQKMGKKFQHLIDPPWESSGEWSSSLETLGGDPCATKAKKIINSEFDRLEGIFIQSKKPCEKIANCKL